MAFYQPAINRGNDQFGGVFSEMFKTEKLRRLQAPPEPREFPMHFAKGSVRMTEEHKFKLVQKRPAAEDQSKKDDTHDGEPLWNMCVAVLS